MFGVYAVHWTVSGEKVYYISNKSTEYFMPKKIFLYFVLLLFPLSLIVWIYLNTPREEIIPEIPQNQSKADPIVISYVDAGKHTGEYATVTMPVKYQFNNGKYLIFSSRVNPHHTYMVQDEKDRNGFFTVRILIDDLHKFPDDFGSQILGKDLEVTGILTWYQSDPHIIVSKPSQIKIL